MKATPTRTRKKAKDPLWLRLLPLASVVVFLAIWELVVRLRGITPIILPAPSSIADYLAIMTFNGLLPYHLGVTVPPTKASMPRRGPGAGGATGAGNWVTGARGGDAGSRRDATARAVAFGAREPGRRLPLFG